MASVSKRFRALCQAPELLHTINICKSDGTGQALSSLRLWLSINAKRISSCSLDIDGKADPELVLDYLTTLCAAAPLHQLTVSVNTGKFDYNLAWLLPVSSTLQRLDMTFVDELDGSWLSIDVSLLHFSALTSFSVCSYGLDFPPSSALPTSLTHMHFEVWVDGCLPDQVDAWVCLPRPSALLHA